VILMSDNRMLCCDKLRVNVNKCENFHFLTHLLQEKIKGLYHSAEHRKRGTWNDGTGYICFVIKKNQTQRRKSKDNADLDLILISLKNTCKCKIVKNNLNSNTLHIIL